MQPLCLKTQPWLEPLAAVAHSLLVQRVLIVCLRIHDVDTVRVTIEDLKLLGVEPGLLDEFGGAEAMLEGGAGVQIAHSGLDKSPKVARGTMGKLHDPARLAFEEDHVPATDVGCLHVPRRSLDLVDHVAFAGLENTHSG